MIYDSVKGADLKERAQMGNSEAEQFVLGLRSLMNEIGETSLYYHCLKKILLLLDLLIFIKHYIYG